MTERARCALDVMQRRMVSWNLNIQWNLPHNFDGHFNRYLHLADNLNLHWYLDFPYHLVNLAHVWYQHFVRNALDLLVGIMGGVIIVVRNEVMLWLLVRVRWLCVPPPLPMRRRP